uniref:uncharacterized protein n=1 Tax=Pristiophorus japonicus TaxID=55135 RepID=UPI00398F8A81
MARLPAHNITCNADKCTFAAEEINFLGYRVTATRCHIDVIQRMQEATNVKELSSFLDTCNFYLKFIPFYAYIAEPLRMLLCKDVPWEWTDSLAQAFTTLKEKITSPPILALIQMPLRILPQMH